MLVLQAYADLARRYASVFTASWAVRHHLQSPDRLDHELAFLPASLELAETPVHPAPRWTMVGIGVLAIIVVLIGLVGQLDIVASTKGKLVPNAGVKVVQPAITGVVRRILVHDSQRVAAGELLMELDPRQAAADSSKVRSTRVAAALAAARAIALLEAQQSGRSPVLMPVEGAGASDLDAAQNLAEGLAKEYRDKLAGAQADLARREAELQSTQHQIAKLRATAPLARQQAADFKALVERKYVAKSEYLDKEQNALQQEHELDAQISHAHELRAAIVGQRSTVAGITSQFRREQLDALERAKQQLAQVRDEETKAETREGLTTLRAPVSGTVQQLSVHTVGGVVTTAQHLMDIVPDDAMEVEVTVENKDIGFVRAGQAAVVKIDAFPYTRFGLLHGTVKSVSNDAIPDKKLGLSFIARVALPTNRMNINGQWVNLTAGMSATAEINTGKRSVAGYFLDPLARATQESLRER
ncbi:HlyD family type I secretion periplasmic adaptor subunit [Piscinibacter terrae]|uniref:Membrane fusion protein (MFP) family protein n=1 Tax=Piscinibacter terrae TaxID=2496871 RepID=A0A3N7HUK5_9BURK|nr:HlyD family type I secretion periplasmic adaptor subunit [Albitalea terrae]RQP26007.1 HlyD family type I secretion periplasmic adaptor subunit [Albitalea terrae]